MVLSENKKYYLRKRICFIVSIFNIAEAFLKDHIEALSKDFDVYLIGNFSDDEICRIQKLNLTGYKSIHIRRKIDPIEDFKAIFELYIYFKSMGFFAVHSVSPKAGLITSIAGIMAGVTNRIHIFTGQVWATKKGIFRYILMFIDWLIAKLNTKILVDGDSQRNFLIEHNIIKNGIVFGHGSIAGVNTNKFKPSKLTRAEIRNELNILNNHVVFVFLGRLNKEKGMDELLSAFNKLAIENENLYLLLIGVDEDNYISRLHEYSNIIQNVNFHYYGRTSNPERILQAGDIFCLPTYREGFGLSVIEASSLELAVICSDTYGVLDAMVDNVTGLRCKANDVDSLYMKMKELSENSKLRIEMGINGRERVLKYFSSEYITHEWVKMYANL